VVVPSIQGYPSSLPRAYELSRPNGYQSWSYIRSNVVEAV